MSTMSRRSVATEGGQLRALLSLRWRMLRTPRQRRAVVIAMSFLPVLAVVAVLVGQLAPENLRLNFATIAPTVFASFLALAVISPASSAGGSELFPSDQLVAYPVRDRTVFRSTVLLAPANLAWMTSFLALLGITAYAADRGPLVSLSAVTVLTFCLSATILGQALAWFFEGVRQRRAGRVAVRAGAALLVAFALAIQLSGNLTDFLDRLPTTRIALSANFGAQGRYVSWAVPIVLLLGTAATALWLGERACGWTQRQVSDGGLQPETRPVRRRAAATSDLKALTQIDRASVWRSAPLRRGAIVMAVLPGAIAAITEPRWDSLVLLTGLVAAGSGLLFGVNAFGMDGPGALTLEGLPMAPELRYWAKALVIMEFAGLTIAGALLVGAFRADGAPTPTQLTALFCSLVVTSLAVASFCMRVSVRSPHRAELRGRRDTPAPPGAMVAYSTRLAWRTTWIAMVLSIVALAPWPWLPLAVAVPMGCLAGMSLIRSSREWQDETVRARVVATVSSG